MAEIKQVTDRSAMIVAKNAVKDNPDDRDARMVLANLYLDAGDFSGAEQNFRRALSLGVAPSQVAVPMARALFSQGKYRDIIADSSDPRTLSTKAKAEILLIKGQAYAELGELQDARESLKRASILDPENIGVYIRLGWLALSQREFDEVKKNTELARAISDKNIGLLLLLGSLEQMKGNFFRAEQVYRDVLSRQPGNANAQYQLAWSLIFQNKIKDAEVVVKAFPDKSTTSVEPVLLRGTLAYVGKDYDAALLDLNKVVQIVPDHIYANLLLAATHYSLGNMEQAEVIARRIVAKNPGFIQARKLLAGIYINRGEDDKVLPLLEDSLPYLRDDPHLMALLGSSLIKTGDIDAAIDMLDSAADASTKAIGQQSRQAADLLRADEVSKALKVLAAEDVGQQRTGATDQAITEISALLRSGDFEAARAAVARLKAQAPGGFLSHYLMGLTLYGLGNKDAARDEFEQALDIAPGQVSASISLATLDYEQGNAEAALARYHEVLEKQPDHLSVLILSAELNRLLGHTDAAKQQLQHAMDAHPAAWQPRVLLAHLYLLQGDASEALAVTAGLMKTDPDNTELLSQVGEAQIMAGAPGDAIETFGRLVRLAPQAVDAHYLLAKAYSASGRIDLAEQELAKALDLKPEDYRAGVAMTRILLARGQVAKADALLAGLAEHHPQAADVLALQGAAALRKGDADAAVRLYAKAVKQAPTSQLTIDLVAALTQAGDIQSAFMTLKEWLEAHPRDHYALANLAALFARSGQVHNAVIAYSLLLKHNPDNAKAHNNLALLLLNNEPGKALKHAERAFALQPDNPAVIDTLGVILIQTGDMARAIDVLGAAKAASPANRYHLAVALDAEGRSRDAVPLLQELLEDEPSFPERGEAEALLEKLSK